MKRILLCGLMLFSILPDVAFSASEAEMKSEFAKLNTERLQSEELIEFLKSSDKATETESGNLKATDPDDEKVSKIIKRENDARDRQFKLISELNNETEQEVRAAFAEKMGVKKNDNPQTVLRIHGSNTVGEKLTPELIREWLAFRGAVDVSMKRDGVVTQFVYRDSIRDSDWKSVIIAAHGTSTAFTKDDIYPEAGLAGGFCDIGMASRPAKAEEVEAIIKAGLGDISKEGSVFPAAVDGLAIFTHQARHIPSLTVGQVAAVFSGEIKNWSELGGTDEAIVLYTRDNHSGTYDTFDSKVLKPLSKKISPEAKRFESSSDLVKGCATDPAGIGFVGLAYVNSTINLVPISASSETRPLMASRLTIKSLDYPLARLLYFYAPAARSQVASEYLDFVMSDRGQAVVDKVGLIGQGLALASDIREADILKSNLLEDATAPADYKKAIQNADRRDTLANVRFESGELTPDVNSRQNLRRLANYLASANTDAVTVVCIGFADNQGSEAGNLQISQSRAKAVEEFLTTLGVRAVESTGFGEAMPVADNKTADGRSANRRVEIWLRR